MDLHNPKSGVCLPISDLPRVVVIGAGFGGINFIKKIRNKPVQIILIDKNNFHQFQPLLYQVAIAGLEPDSIVTPIRKLFHGYNNFNFRMAEVIEIDHSNNKVITNIGWVQYDYLVIATGSVSNYYGLDNIEHSSVGLKDIRDSLDIRSWVLQNLEKAVITCDDIEKDALTNFVIVGGGPAGVELAGALAEFKKYLLHKDYPELAKDWMRIYLIEAADRLLNVMSPKSSNHALKVLQKLDVTILLNTAVKDYDGHTVLLADSETLKARSLIWTAGVKGYFPKGIPDNIVVRGSRLKVDEYNKVQGLDNVYAIGDVAAQVSEDLPRGHPLLAPVAIQQGDQLGENIMSLIKDGKYKKPFIYKDKGSMATIGKNSAVVEVGKKQLSGWLAWVMWSTVHLFSITGFKNRLIVGVNWMIRYINYEKANRLIIRPFEPDENVLEKQDNLKRKAMDNSALVAKSC